MSDKPQYLIAQGANALAFEAEVNDLLRQGYVLYGAPFEATDRYSRDRGHVNICQAMVRRGCEKQIIGRGD